MIFIHPCKINFVCFFVFFLDNDVYFEYTWCYKKMTIKEVKDFIFKNYYRQIGYIIN